MNSLPFFPVVDNTNFGGNQAWFSKKLYRHGGCGIIAASNLIFFYQKKLHLKRASFMALSESLYHYLGPLHLYNPFDSENTFGLPFFRRYMYRLESYLRILGIKKKHYIYRGKNPDKAFSFIKKSIDNSEPVIMLLIGFGPLKEYNNHYMTITGYDRDKDVEIEVSTWGKKQKLKLKDLLQGSLLFYLGSFYE